METAPRRLFVGNLAAFGTFRASAPWSDPSIADREFNCQTLGRSAICRRVSNCRQSTDEHCNRAGHFCATHFDARAIPVTTGGCLSRYRLRRILDDRAVCAGPPSAVRATPGRLVDDDEG